MSTLAFTLPSTLPAERKKTEPHSFLWGFFFFRLLQFCSLPVYWTEQAQFFFHPLWTEVDLPLSFFFFLQYWGLIVISPFIYLLWFCIFLFVPRTILYGRCTICPFLCCQCEHIALSSTYIPSCLLLCPDPTCSSDLRCIVLQCICCVQEISCACFYGLT